MDESSPVSLAWVPEFEAWMDLEPVGGEKTTFMNLKYLYTHSASR